MVNHVVLWDGTATRPWGKMIFAPQPAQVQPEPPPKIHLWGNRTQQIKSVVRKQTGLFTADDLVSIAGIERDLICSLLGQLARAGELKKIPKVDRTARQQYQVVR